MKYISEAYITEERICFVCGHLIESETWVERVVDIDLHVVAHELCSKGLMALISKSNKVDTDKEIQSELLGFIEEIDGHPVLIKRNLSSNSHYVLGYFAFHKGETCYPSDLLKWVEVNSLRISNPYDYIKKLTMSGKLARVPDQDGKFRYTITDAGYRELIDYLKEA